jgi:hypothetical protein
MFTLAYFGEDFTSFQIPWQVNVIVGDIGIHTGGERRIIPGIYPFQSTWDFIIIVREHE